MKLPEPVGFPNPNKEGDDQIHIGHLIAASLYGSNTLDNLVPQFRKVNLSDMKIVEYAVFKAVQGRPATDKRKAVPAQAVVYRVWAQYPTLTEPFPRWIFVDAIGADGFTCQLAIENTVTGTVPKGRC